LNEEGESRWLGFSLGDAEAGTFWPLNVGGDVGAIVGKSGDEK
jgi:hypothetical protein